MEKELYECDVIWPEYQNGTVTASNYSTLYDQEELKVSKSSATAPVSIPAVRRSCRREYVGDEVADELVPPHVLVARGGYGEKAAFSVCSGQGRTLKGRDLRLVRDSVLRMTGFLET